ncbi:hypothetical protein OVS_01075 [Mycoplasma ovis str. Michigan]|uniref:Uncharacterized protein n=1 Tax=Mycoplasma ovis str. Michigan TaxID=1415773 RepID=A0ABM5P157_9MOLU|nr:hypothetical protein [Mycoplasma ovis]AHC40176.1 hypothetical protein OVS_01075 [Mycoplasma ovis str. Michigan]
MYVCARNDGSAKPSFFYYDRTKWNRLGASSPEKPEKILSLGYDNSSKAKAYLESKEYKDLVWAPFWMSKWKKETLKPEEQCQIKKHNNNSSLNLLTCKHLQDEKGKTEWTQYITAIL